MNWPSFIDTGILGSGAVLGGAVTAAVQALFYRPHMRAVTERERAVAEKEHAIAEKERKLAEAIVTGASTDLIQLWRDANKDLRESGRELERSREKCERERQQCERERQDIRRILAGLVDIGERNMSALQEVYSSRDFELWNKLIGRVNKLRNQ